MNTGVELHDSSVADVACADRQLRVVFQPAYVHQSDGIPGNDSGWAYLQPVEFVFSEAVFSEKGECRGAVSDGFVRSAEAEHLNLVPMPLDLSGSISAELQFVSGGILKVFARAFACTALGEPDPGFRERFEG
jgi:hypothetical protein